MPITENSIFTVRFNMVATSDWRAKLQALAAEAVTKESEIMRRLVERAYLKRFGKKHPGQPVPKCNTTSAREAKAKRAKK